MWHWLFSLALVVVALWIFLRWFEYRNVFHPYREVAPAPRHLARAPEAVRIPTPDGVELGAWFFPADPASSRAALTVIVSHGNGGNISHRISLYEILLDLGVSLLAYDYRGYGTSTGRPTEAGTYTDAEAAVDWLVARGIPEERIVVHGESLGGAVTAELALRRPRLRGAILRSTFTSVPDLGTELFPFLPVRLVSAIHYATREKLPRIKVPLLFLHSREDTLIGFHHAEANFAAATEPKRLVEIRGDHNDQPDASPEVYRRALGEFLDATASRAR